MQEKDIAAACAHTGMHIAPDFSTVVQLTALPDVDLGLCQDSVIVDLEQKRDNGLLSQEDLEAI